MISVAEAKHRLLDGLSPVGSETVSLSQATGRVLAEPVTARLTRPSADTSAMDGYAVRSADLASLGADLKEVEHLPAGSVSQVDLEPGTCARIFTGAHLPAGADAILIQEDAERRETEDGVRVLAKTSIEPRTYVRAKGMDFSAGQPLIEAGCRLTGRDVGLLAAANIPWVSVRRKPRIALLATGDEIVMPGEPLAEGQIIGSASHSLESMVSSCGGDALVLGVARDEPGALAKAAENAAGCDFLVTIGGASVGDYDLVHDVLGADGAGIDFQKIAMRPGKPLMFGTSGAVRLLGLPGNPVSAYLCGLLFLRPALFALLGCPQDERFINMPAAFSLPKNGIREHYMRATFERRDGVMVVAPFDDQDSSLVATLARADGLVVRPVNAPAVEAGEPVPVLPFQDGPANL